jgi:hypothetical protein
MEKFSVNRKKVENLNTVRELQEYLDWLQPNSRKLMWEVYDGLHKILKLHCWNNKKTWSNDAKENVKRFLTDPFNHVCMGDVVAKTGRSPFAIYMIWILQMWEATRNDSKRVLLKRTITSAVRHGYAQWN